MLVVAQKLVSLADTLESHRLPQDGPHLGFLDQLVCLGRLPRVREVRADDLLLSHPQVADVEIELITGRRAADHNLPERPHDQHRGRERGFADVLEHYVRWLAQDRLDSLAEPPRLLEAGPLLVYGLAAATHHPLELGPVDVANRAELLDQLALRLAR